MAEEVVIQAAEKNGNIMTMINRLLKAKSTSSLASVRRNESLTELLKQGK